MLNILRKQVQMYRLRAEWKQLSSTAIEKTHQKPIKKLMILPCDPWSVIGSRGDEAMILAIVDKLQEKEPNLDVGVITASDKASEVSRALGFEPFQVWYPKWSLLPIIQCIERFGADGVLLLGADVMDGYYDFVTTARLLVTADMMARKGMFCAVSGFSFNEQASPVLVDVFNKLTLKLRLNVRDPVSLERFQHFCQASAYQVADAAFMLQPKTTPFVEDIARWCNAQREQGHQVLAFNMHPMLIKNASTEDIQGLVDAGVDVIRKISMTHKKVSWLLLPHDSRQNLGDNTVLAPIYHVMKQELSERLFHLAVVPSAKELKAIAGLCDGVITGRMHLAIASLGQGVPVACLTYQDKFQGLFQHFSLGTEFLMSPQMIFSQDAFECMLNDFIQALPNLAHQVQAVLPDVKKYSQSNLIAFL